MSSYIGLSVEKKATEPQAIFCKHNCMHDSPIPLLAALACALCNGSAAMLKKISADDEHNAAKLDIKLLLRLVKNKRYLLSIILDIIGWGFCLYALQYLPLFLVGAVVASNIVVTALLERAFLGQKIMPRSYLAVLTVLCGLAMLALAASPTTAKPLDNSVLRSMLLAPIVIAGMAYLLSHWKSYKSSSGLALLAGLSFGTTSVAGRALHVEPPLWHILINPLLLVVVASTVLGALIFSTALQRAQATVMNACMSASQTLAPAIAGLVFLGDSPRKGLGYMVLLGCAFVVGGVIHLALEQRQVEQLTPENT